MSLKVPLTKGNTQGLPLAVGLALVNRLVGGITPQPIAAGTQWVIVRLDAKRPTQIPGFDQAKDTVRQQLQTLALEKASAQFVGTLMKGATIQQ